MSRSVAYGRPRLKIVQRDWPGTLMDSNSVNSARCGRTAAHTGSPWQATT